MAHPWQIEWHDELDSTNRIAMERVIARWSRDESAAGIAIAARRQTAGRGQHGRIWSSPPGGLYLSLVVDVVPMDIRARLALVAGVAVADTLGAAGVFSPAIRWPNDLMLNEKKVAGILCEATALADRWAAVIGIGINVNTITVTLPADLRATATSLFEQDRRERSLEPLADSIAQHLEGRLAVARNKGLGPIGRVRALDALRGQRVQLRDAEGIVTGVGAGIADDGSLMIQLSDGTVRTCTTGSLMH